MVTAKPTSVSKLPVVIPGRCESIEPGIHVR